MVEIEVYIVPKGDRSRKELIGQAEIAYEEGTQEVGNYSYKLHGGFVGWNKRKNSWKRGSILNFPRERLGVWDLLIRVLFDAIAKRNSMVNLGGLARTRKRE